MKKILLAITVAATSLTFAQEASVGMDDFSGATAQGRWMLGSDFGLSYQGNTGTVEVDGNELDGDVKTSQFSINPNVSYFVIDKLAVGLGLQFVSNSSDNGVSDVSTNSFAITPNAKYFFGETNIKPYVGVGVGYMSQTTDNGEADSTLSGLAWNGQAGVSYFFNNTFAANLGLDYVNSTLSDSDIDNVDYKSSTFGLNLGLSVFL